jgi:hypothetical protein
MLRRASAESRAARQAASARHDRLSAVSSRRWLAAEERQRAAGARKEAFGRRVIRASADRHRCPRL